MLKKLLTIYLLINFLGLFADELADKIREQEKIKSQLETAQQKIQQTETRKKQTETDINRTASLRRVTDSKLRKLTGEGDVLKDSLRSVSERIRMTESKMQGVKSLINDEMQILLRVDRSYRSHDIQHRDHRYLTRLIDYSNQTYNIERGMQIALTHDQESHQNEFTKVDKSIKATDKEKRNYDSKLNNLEYQKKQLSKEQQQLQARIAQLKKDAAALESLIARLTAQHPDSGVSTYKFTEGRIAWPVKGRVIRSYGQVTKDYNTSVVSNGIDIAIPLNTSVVAGDNGTVVFADRYGGQGKMIIIDHKNGFFTVYAYCNELLVGTGATVKRGQTIARSGNTGSASEPSLHFEVRKDGNAVNPMTYLQ
ncbi:MAG TPA: peptidoglycan DD-metalloendopeptidase family protein [Candidatus Cloacimonadota bacterium]|nr:peptidoglycan DD-metalloendopeptidase family protein [Candidatus Cloacimonadota bacterium]